MIKVVAFDLDDTLFNGTLLVEKARRSAVEMMIEFGLPIDLEAGLKILNEVVEEFGSNSESHLDNMLIRLQKDPKYNLNPSFNINKYVAAGIMGYHREKVKHFKPFRDVGETIKKLRDKGIKTAIVTDGTPKKQYEKILRLKVENLFDEIIISDEVAIRKPNPLLFQLFCTELGCSPSEAIYVGDRLDKDIEPAMQAGLYAVLIHRGTKHDPNINKIKSVLKPHFHINSLHELFAIIEKINS